MLRDKKFQHEAKMTRDLGQDQTGQAEEADERNWLAVCRPSRRRRVLDRWKVGMRAWSVLGAFAQL
jgi:hypothetical protein